MNNFVLYFQFVLLILGVPSSVIPEVTSINSNSVVNLAKFSNAITQVAFGSQNTQTYGNYTYDEINQIFYDLYFDYQNSNQSKEYAHYHNIAILIDIICTVEGYEDTVEACDILDELPLYE